MTYTAEERSWVDANNKPLRVGDQVTPIHNTDDIWIIYKVETSDRDYPIYYVYRKDDPDISDTLGRDQIRKFE